MDERGSFFIIFLLTFHFTSQYTLFHILFSLSFLKIYIDLKEKTEWCEQGLPGISIICIIVKFSIPCKTSAWLPKFQSRKSGLLWFRRCWHHSCNSGWPFHFSCEISKPGKYIFSPILNSDNGVYCIMFQEYSRKPIV